MTNPATNLVMSMQLVSPDPYAGMHARYWGKTNLESVCIETDTLDVPVEGNLTAMESQQFRTLDLGISCPILPDQTSKMLIRDEYDELWKYVESDRRNIRRRFGGVVITGHPGIGKSFGLYYYLFKTLIAAHPIALQTDKNSFFVFVESGVYLVRFTSNTAIYDIQYHLKQLGCVEGMIALVNSSERSPAPAPIFLDTRFPFYVIQTTDPCPSRWRDWVKQTSANVLVTKPWSWSEIFIGVSLFVTPTPSAAELYEIFERYGPVPRVCFNLLGDERRIRVYAGDVRRESVGSPPFLDVVQANGFSESFYSLSSLLLMISDASRSPLVKITSQHIAQNISFRMAVSDVSEICSILASDPLTEDTAPYLFRNVVLRHMSEGSFPFNLVFSSLSMPNTNSSFNLPPNVNPTGSRITIDSMPRTLIPKHCYVLQETEGVGIASYDAVLRISNYIYLLKVVTDTNSPILTPELDKLADGVMDIAPDRGMNVVFIVPLSMKSRFGKQPIVGDGNYTNPEWNFEQMVVYM